MLGSAQRRRAGAFLLDICLLVACSCIGAAADGDTDPAATAPRKKKRNLSLISNILDDLGLDETQKAIACAVMAATVFGIRYFQGRPMVPHDKFATMAAENKAEGSRIKATALMYTAKAVDVTRRTKRDTAK